MLSDIRFSVPLWPGLSPEDIENDVYPFLEECRLVISDIYITSRIPPFNQDAMGGILFPEDVGIVENNSLVISDKFDIPLSLTFNNITVSPSFENYLTFLENFKRLYDLGIRIVTIPNTAWLRFGLKKEFPDLFVKNTILNRVQTAAEVVSLFEEGFDYINLDKNLVRDTKTLKEIYKAKLITQKKLSKQLFVSLLHNEMCESYCPVQQDHYIYNLHRDQNTPAYFDSKMSNISPCVVKDEKSILWAFKSASIPSFYSQLDHYSNYIDVFKMHGRESRHVFYKTMRMITQFVRRQPIEDPYRSAFEDIPNEIKKTWLKTVVNCKFNCWQCRVCEDTAEKITTIRSQVK